MALSEQYNDDAVGGVNMNDHVDDSEFSAGFGVFGRTGQFTTNHAAFVLVVIGVLGLWIIQRVFKGA